MCDAFWLSCNSILRVSMAFLLLLSFPFYHFIRCSTERRLLKLSCLSSSSGNNNQRTRRSRRRRGMSQLRNTATPTKRTEKKPKWLIVWYLEMELCLMLKHITGKMDEKVKFKTFYCCTYLKLFNPKPAYTYVIYDVQNCRNSCKMSNFWHVPFESAKFFLF